MKIFIIGTVGSSILGFRGDLIKVLVSQGHNVFALASDFSCEQKKTLSNWGVTALDYQISRAGINPLNDLKTVFCLRDLMREIKPDLVFSYFAKPVIYGSIAARLAGVNKVLAMIEGLGYVFTDSAEGASLKTKILRKIQVLLYRISLPFVDNLIFLNPDDINDLVVRHKLKPKRVSLLGAIGLDLKLFKYHRPSNNKLNFLFVGRLLVEKGVFYFVDAARIVKKRYPHVDFTILGGLDESNPGGMKLIELERLVSENIVNYPGKVSNVIDYLNDCSVFVLPSYYREGVPRSTQEAMAVGRPVITTNVPGCKETVIDGENGFLIPPFDAQALAEKMIWFIEHPEQIEPMGIASRRIAEEKFDVHKVNARMLEIIELT